MRVKGQRADLPRQPSTVAESCSFRLPAVNSAARQRPIDNSGSVHEMEAAERETGQTPAGPSHCEIPRRPAAPAARETKRKKTFFSSLSASYDGSGASEACLLSIQVWTLDRVLLCSQAITTAAGVFATALRIRPWPVALALRFNRRILNFRAL